MWVLRPDNTGTLAHQSSSASLAVTLFPISHRVKPTISLYPPIPLQAPRAGCPTKSARASTSGKLSAVCSSSIGPVLECSKSLFLSRLKRLTISWAFESTDAGPQPNDTAGKKDTQTISADSGRRCLWMVQCCICLLLKRFSIFRAGISE